MYKHQWLADFPLELADSIIEMALERVGLVRSQLDSLSDAERQRLDAMICRLVRADDVPDKCC